MYIIDLPCTANVLESRLFYESWYISRLACSCLELEALGWFGRGLSI
jgi:hypothetical protein